MTDWPSHSYNTTSQTAAWIGTFAEDFCNLETGQEIVVGGAVNTSTVPSGAGSINANTSIPPFAYLQNYLQNPYIVSFADCKSWFDQIVGCPSWSG